MSAPRHIRVDPQAPSETSVQEAAAILTAGGIIGFPTETVYGLAALITDHAAIERLRRLKSRPRDKQFTVCIHSAGQVERYAETISPVAMLLMRAFWPGPLTLVLPAGESATVGLRVPSHPVAQMLLRRLEAPIFAPSANRANEQAPRTAQQVLEAFDNEIDAVLDAGPTPLGVSSTVCRVEGEQIRLLRAGAIREEDLRRAGKRIHVLFVCAGNTCRSPMAEGFMRSFITDIPQLAVASAGIAAFEGLPASDGARQAMRRFQIDISPHRSRALTDEMIREADLILVMEEAQRRHIVTRRPEAAGRVELLTAYGGDAGRSAGIADPMGQTLEVYAQTASTLKQLIERTVQRLS